MQRLLRVLPHVLTLSNLAAGCVACIALVRGDFDWVPWCLLVSAVADFLDGFAARAAGVSGPFGRELDSLADMVSFGVSPGLMAFAMLGGGGLYPQLGADAFAVPDDLHTRPIYAYAALLIPLMSAVRLARFNVEQADTKHFVGLATPANTVLWFSLFMVWHADALGLRQNLSHAAVVLPLVALTGYLLVSEVTYPSNKLDPRAVRNWPVWVVAAALLVLPFLIGWAGVAAGMGLYVLSGAVWRPAEAT